MSIKYYEFEETVPCLNCGRAISKTEELCSNCRTMKRDYDEEIKQTREVLQIQANRQGYPISYRSADKTFIVNPE